MKPTLTIGAAVIAVLLAGCGGKYQAVTVDLEEDKAIIEAYNSTTRAGIGGDEEQAQQVAWEEAVRACGIHKRRPTAISGYCKFMDLGCVRYQYLFACQKSN